MRFVGALVAILVLFVPSTPSPARAVGPASRVTGPVTSRHVSAARQPPRSAASPVNTPPATQRVEVIETNADLSHRMTRLADRRFVPGTIYGLPTINVDDTTRYQQVHAFGAAMTDSSAWLLERAARDPGAALNALFGTGGLRLSFVRVPMGASDFVAAGQPYSYDDQAAGQPDASLAGFSVAHDSTYVIPALRAARTLNRKLWLLATPWSPPGWMKANDALDNLAHRGTLLPTAVQAWAQYFARFLEDYRAAGVPVDAISLQNEPNNPTSYPGLELPAAEANHLLNAALVPTLRSAALTPQIFGNELGWSSRSVGYARATATARAARALTGIAWHCYYGTPDVIDTIHALAPRLDQIISECATGLVPFPPSELLIGALRHWASAVALWNIALDPTGGPVEAPNTGCPGCTALLTVDPVSGSATPTASFFQLGQVSRYVQPGAVRIASEHYVAYHYSWAHMTQSIVTPGLDDVAFLNPDGSRVLVVYANTTAAASFTVQWHGGWFVDTLPAGATATFVWRP